MSKEEQIQEYRSKQLIDELSKMPPMVIATAYLHAINYTLYGEDVTEKWLTAIQNESALEKAYRKGYYDALQRLVKSAEWIDDKCSSCGKGIEDLITSSEWYRNENPKYCPFCGIKIHPHKAESEGKVDE